MNTDSPAQKRAFVLGAAATACGFLWTRNLDAFAGPLASGNLRASAP
eukprot:CAMPEP_0168396652 /NCGR_PEP_ID=MMETSP0228-20121227/20661_1 /TAXON_ID=133427 /ORGANISM="Protoceratium reticulatum, Strain CCCM 535 (=CCMP 1889)" /LENGTH=46 /DNA_ID= /DNA_START= /DNA_END= /DNA_ORIENTATION=